MNDINLPLEVPEVSDNDKSVLGNLRILSWLGYHVTGRYYISDKIYVVKGDDVSVCSDRGIVYLGKLTI